jgi:hypothetical protein
MEGAEEEVTCYLARMLYRVALACSMSLVVAACGDSANPAADAPQTPADATAADAPVDAVVCDPTGYPERVRPESVDLLAPTTLTLDGTGTLCEQLIRALIDPTGRPPELANLDAEGVTGTCSHDDVLDREIVRLRAPLYAGQPVYAPVQDVLAHVDATSTVVFLHGDFLPAGEAPGPGCLDASAAAAVVPGRAMSYERFAACSPQGAGEYTIAADDEIEVGDEGFYLDVAGDLRRVWAVDVYLLASHVTTEIGNSDAYCCDGSTGNDHCVGMRLFIDAFTGETVGQEPHCHIC